MNKSLLRRGGGGGGGGGGAFSLSDFGIDLGSDDEQATAQLIQLARLKRQKRQQKLRQRMASQPFQLQATFPIFVDDGYNYPILFLCCDQQSYVTTTIPSHPSYSSIVITSAMIHEAINMISPSLIGEYKLFDNYRFPVLIVYFVHHPTSTIIRKVFRKSDLSRTQRQKKQFIPLQDTDPIFEGRDTAQSTTSFSRAYQNAKIPGQAGTMPDTTASIINFLNTSTSSMKKQIEDELIFFGLNSLRQYGIPYDQIHKPAVENYNLYGCSRGSFYVERNVDNVSRPAWILGRNTSGRAIHFHFFRLNAYISINIVLESMGSLLKATEALGILRPHRIERGPYPSATWSYKKQILLEQSGDQPPLPSSSTASIVSNYQDYRRENPEAQIPIATPLANVVASLQGESSSSSS
jgi:hypothetical protein